MDKIQELINILSDDRVKERTGVSRNKQTCKICGEPANEFLNASSEFEFLVSAICQDCQNYYLFRDH